MQHHLRSVAPGRLAAASRQSINRLSRQSNSCQFHVYAPQSLPQPTIVNPQDVAPTTGSRTPRYQSNPIHHGPPSSTRSSQDAEDSKKRRNMPGWMIRKRASEFADARWAMNPEAQEDKWKRYRDEPFLLENLPDREMMTGWSLEERFKYKMVTRQNIFNGQEELNDHQKHIVDMISKGKNLIFDGVSSNPHITLALAAAVAKKICQNRAEGERTTGVLVFCNTVERCRAIERYLKTLLNCYKVNTLMVAPRESGKNIPHGTLPYERVIQALDDIDCHALIITRSTVQSMLHTDPDARRLMRMVDWQTVVVDEAEHTLDTAAGRFLQSLGNILPVWMKERPRQHIFLADNATINVKQWASVMAMAPLPVVQVGPPKQPDPVSLATKVEQGFLTFPDDNPRHLFPSLTTFILKERAANVGRFKAIVFFNSAQEARLAANYYRKVEIEPALPPINYLGFQGFENDAVEGSYVSAKSFFEAKEGILFAHDASLCGSNLKDITHIFQITPLDGYEYIKRLNVADLTGTDPSATIPVSTVLTFPFESGWLSGQKEVIAQRQAGMATTLPNPTPEDLAATADLDAFIRPHLDPKQQDDAYMEWIKYNLPYLEAWNLTTKNELIMRAGQMFREGWGAKHRDPVVKLSFAERLGIAGEPALLTEDNMKQVKEEQKACQKNIKEERHKHWRGRKKWVQQHGKAPAMTIRGIAKGTTRIT